MSKKLSNHHSKKLRGYDDVVTIPDTDAISISETDDGVNFHINSDGIPEKEKKEIFYKVVKKTGFPLFEGHIEHAYDMQHVDSTDHCPRCQAATKQHYSNFIYATQIAPRVMFAPAGYFCSQCPTVIINENMIIDGITGGKFKFKGVLGLDYEEKNPPDFFDTWNGEKPVYIFDENQIPLGIAISSEVTSSGIELQVPDRKRRSKKKSRGKMANKSRKINRRK